MKINKVTGAIGAYQHSGTRRANRSEGVGRTTRSDQFVRSDEARQALALKRKLADVPDVRKERIEELRRQIEAGTYRPDSRAIAARMLESRVFDELI